MNPLFLPARKSSTLNNFAPRWLAVFTAIAALFFAAASNDARAQSFITWQGTGTNWTTAGNWNATYGYAQLQWTGGGNATSWNDYGSAQGQWRFYFSGSTAYTLGGTAVNFTDFGGANGGILSDSSALQTINMNISFRDSGARTAFIMTRGSGGITFGGGVEVTNSVTALGIGGTNSASIITFNGVVSGNKPIVIGTNSLAGNTTDAGETRVVFAGNNTYTGATTVERGALTITHANALGTADAGTTVKGNAVLRMSGDITVASEALTLSGGGFAESGALRSMSGSNNYDGLITLSASPTYLAAASSATLKVSAINGGSNELWIVGDGTTILASGATNSGSGTAFVKTNVGTAVLSASNAWSGNEFIREGIVVLNHNNALGFGGTTTLGATAGAATATLRYGENIINSNAVTIQSGGAGTRTLAYLAGTGTGRQVGNLTLGSGVTIDVTTGGTFFVDGAIGGSGGPLVTVQGGGTLGLTSASSDTSARWSIGNGTTLAIGNTRNLGENPTSYYSNKVTLNGGTLRLTNSTSLTNVGIQAASASIISVDNGITVTNPAVMGGTANITKSGDGILILSAVNTNGGKWTVAGGQLSIGAATHLGAATGNDAVTINGGSLRTSASFDLGSRGITVGASGGTSSVAAATFLTNSSGLYGSGNLVKDGSGVLHLTNTAGTYAGNITVTNGTLQANTALRGANISVGNNGTLNGSVLMGSGQVGTVAINTNGRISPGNSVGILSVSNSLSFNGGGSYLWEIANSTANTPGTGWDLISVDTTAASNGLGTLDIGGSGQFTVNGLAIDGFTFDGAQNYTNNYFLIVRAANITGSTNNLGLSMSGLGAGSWTFSTNSTGLYLNYEAPGTLWVFTNNVAADQGAANTTTNGNSLDQLATITNTASATAVTISNSAAMTFTNPNNSYSGATIVEQGTLVAGVSSLNAQNGAFGNSSANIQVGSLSAGNANAATLSISESGVEVGRGITVNSGGTGIRTIGATNASGTATYSGNILANTNVTLSASNTGATTLFSGAISGSGAITAAGSGVVVLSGANSYTNATTVSSGTTLVAANNTALGAGSGTTTVSSGGTLSLSNNISEDEAIAIAGTGVGGNGALRNIHGANTNAGIITVSANATISADASTRLQLNGIDISGAANRNVTLAGAGDTLLAGGVSTFGADLTNRIIKSGAGNLIISNSGATGNGQVRIGEGAVVIAGGSLTASTNTGIRAIDLGLSGDATGVATANNVSLLARSGVTVSNSVYVAPNESSATRTMGTDSASGTATFANQIFLGGNLRLTSAGTANAVFSGNITNTGTHSLTKVGGGTITLSGANTYGGSAVVEEGALALSGGSALADTVAVAVNGGTLAVNTTETIGALSGSGGSVALNAGLVTSFNAAFNSYAGVFTGSGSLSKNGTGMLALSGNSSDYSGEVILNDGTILVGNAGALGTGTTTINFGTGSRILASSSGTGYTLNHSFNLYNNAFTLGQTSGGTGSLTLGGVGKSFFLGDDATVNVRVVTVNGSHAIAAQITGGANNRIAVAGGGSLTLSGANTFSGGSQLREGTILVGNAAALGAGTLQIQFDQTGTRTLASATSAGYTLANNINIFNTLTLGQTEGGTGSLTLNGAVSLGDPVGELNSRVVTVNGSHSIAGQISGGNALAKAGAGTLTLTSTSNSGNNRYDLLGGELQVSQIGNLGDRTGDFLANKLFFNGGALGATGNITLDGENGITLGGNGRIRVASNNTLTLQGYINDQNLTGLTLSKTGTGTLFFDKTGVNDFSGTTLVINEGVVSTWNPALLPSGVQLGSSTAETSGTYRFAKTDGGVTANNNFTVNSGGGGIQVTDNTLTLGGTLSGSGNFGKTGAGSLMLTGNNGYSGALTVSAGTLQLNRTGGSALGSVGSVNVATGAVLLLSQTDQVNNSAAITLSGGTITRGASVSEAFGNLNITGASFLNFGTGAVAAGAYGMRFEQYANTGSAIVAVSNFLEGNKLQFLSTSFNAGNLSSFTFDNAYTTSIQGDYFTITAIPEPSTYVAAAGLLAIFLWPVRRRLIKDAKSILGLRPNGRDRIESYRGA